jgi:arylsulfatase A-like enzyme
MEVSRRGFLELAAAAGAATLTSAKSQQEKTPPNIIFMLADDQRSDAMGCMGNPTILTPQMDRLAAQGIVFDNHFCTTPICCASRASIMTGQYAGTTGIYDFVRNLSPEQVNETYWMRMKMAGYYIGFIGKYGVGNKPASEAFDYWKGFAEQGTYFPDGPAGPHLTDIMRDQATDFLARVSTGRPFCLSISFKAPHVQDESPSQYLPSPSTLDLYKDVTIPSPRGACATDIQRFPLALQHSESRRRWGVRFATPELYQASTKGYYRLISGNDMAIGAIREALEKRGLADNTIIVYSADHGVFNGEHGLAGKWYAHEEAIRIPLLIYDPRLPANVRGRRYGGMSLNIDLNPTLLEMAGLKVPQSVQGRSLAAVVRGERHSTRNICFLEHHFPDGGWIPSSEGIRTERWKYIRYTDSAAPFEELYDLKSDPSETSNLIGKPRYASQQRALTGYSHLWRDSLRGATDRWSEPVTEVDLVRDGLV